MSEETKEIDYEKILKLNNIEIPRLRFMNMADEIEKMSYPSDNNDIALTWVERLTRAIPRWDYNSNMSCLSRKTDRLEKYYIKNNTIQWNKIHGKAKKKLKFIIKKTINHRNKIVDMLNKYAGQKNVMHVIARINGWSADCIPGIKKSPWFLDMIEDWWDKTYCHVFVKIDKFPED